MPGERAHLMGWRDSQCLVHSRNSAVASMLEAERWGVIRELRGVVDMGGGVEADNTGPCRS